MTLGANHVREVANAWRDGTNMAAPVTHGPRRSETVCIFADDSLEMVWITTKPEDEKRLRERMAGAYHA